MHPQSEYMCVEHLGGMFSIENKTVTVKEYYPVLMDGLHRQVYVHQKEFIFLDSF